jgi:hypothetical protein
MADPEGGEFRAFLHAGIPAERLHTLVVDSADPLAQAVPGQGAARGCRITPDCQGRRSKQQPSAIAPAGAP